MFPHAIALLVPQVSQYLIPHHIITHIISAQHTQPTARSSTPNIPHTSHTHTLSAQHTHHAPHTSRTLLARAGERRRGRARSRSQITTRRLSFASLRLDAWYQRRQRRQRRRRMRRRCCRRRVAFLRQHRHVLNVRVDREERVVARRVSPATPHLCVVPRGVRGYTYGTAEGRGIPTVCVWSPKARCPAPLVY